LKIVSACERLLLSQLSATTLKKKEFDSQQQDQQSSNNFPKFPLALSVVQILPDPTVTFLRRPESLPLANHRPSSPSLVVRTFDGRIRRCRVIESKGKLGVYEECRRGGSRFVELSVRVEER